MARSTLAVLALAGLAAAGTLAPRQDNETAPAVDITALTKNVSATTGTGAVSAAGTLQPFGGIGVGCGINWAEGQSFGGGLQSGSESFGLGGGFTITKDTMNIGLGIGINPINFNSSLNFVASTNGTVDLFFTSTSQIKCEEATVDGVKGTQPATSPHMTGIYYEHALRRQVQTSNMTTTACKPAAKDVVWTAQRVVCATRRAATKLSTKPRAFSETQEFEPVIQFHPTIGGCSPGQVDYTDLDSWVEDVGTGDFFDCGDDFSERMEDILEGEYDDMPDLLGRRGKERVAPPVPSIILTTPEGDVLVGDDIPQGKRCSFSHEYHTLMKQWLETLEHRLVPGDWKQLRSLNRPEPAVDYAAREAVHESHLRLEEKKRKRHERRARRDHDQKRRRERDEAQHRWELQKMEVEYLRQERGYSMEERETVAMDWQQDKAEETLRRLRAELEEMMERDFGEESEDEF
ncbi:hypothetical protein EsH8_I_000408 [Colletotrichum jinshuiense]